MIKDQSERHLRSAGPLYGCPRHGSRAAIPTGFPLEGESLPFPAIWLTGM